MNTGLTVPMLALLASLATLNPQLSTCFAQSTAFTYQGRLDDGANPASGSYDLRFAIYDAAGAGTQQGGTLTNTATAVTNGLFTVALDFGNQFPGADRWLEIGVRTNGNGAFSTLTPRQPLTATPYAVRAVSAANAASVSGSIAASQLTGTISSNNIGAGSISSVMLANGAVGSNQLAAGAVTTSAIAGGAVTGDRVATVTNWFPFPLPHPMPEPGDNYGSRLAAVGTNLVLIGAPSSDAGIEGSGAAYLLNRNGSVVRSFLNPFIEFRGGFGSSVAGVGQTHFIIGAPDNNEFGPIDSGAAYLYRMDGTRERTFTKPEPRFGDEQFGSAVCGFGPAHILIAAQNALGPSSEFGSGTVYLFRTNGPLVTTFTNPTPAVGDNFGSAIAPLQTDRVLIAAPGDDMGANGAGAAYLFGTNGVLLTTFTNPAPAANDRFGQAIAALGGMVVIGATGDDTGANDAGVAYLFSTNGTLLVTITNPSPAASDFFGSSVAALADDLIVIGAFGDDVGRADSGAAYLFHVSGTLVAVLQDNPGSVSIGLGNALSVVDSQRVLVGGGGSAFLFSQEAFTPELTASSLRLGTITTAHLTDGAVTAAKIGGVLLASQIPDLNANKIVTGTLNSNRIPNLDAAKITSGTLDNSRLDASVSLLGPTIEAGELAATIGLWSASSSNVTYTAGNVGIGTTTPGATLRVQGYGATGNVWVSPTAGSGNAELFLSETVSGSFGMKFRHNGVNNLTEFIGVNSSVETVPLVSIGRGNTGGVTIANDLVVGGTINGSSDRNVKKNFTPVDPLAVLEKVNALPIQQWTYQAEADAVRHVGPMAQDFHAAFGLGTDNRHIATVDADGVALAAIQGLNQKLQQKESEIAELKAELAEIKGMLVRLSRNEN